MHRGLAKLTHKINHHNAWLPKYDNPSEICSGLRSGEVWRWWHATWGRTRVPGLCGMLHCPLGLYLQYTDLKIKWLRTVSKDKDWRARSPKSWALWIATSTPPPNMFLPRQRQTSKCLSGVYGILLIAFIFSTEWGYQLRGRRGTRWWWFQEEEEI